MDKNHINYVEELNQLWHKLIELTQFKQYEDKYSHLRELSTVEIGIINMVAYKPDVIFREICEAFDLPKSSLTSIIDRLEKWRYLKRTISSRDRRSYGLELTDIGLEAQKEHLSYEYETMSGIINALDTQGEKQEFITLLGKIVTKLDR